MFWLDLKVYGRLQTHVDGLHHKIQLLEKDKASLLEEVCGQRLISVHRLQYLLTRLFIHFDRGRIVAN